MNNQTQDIFDRIMSLPILRKFYSPYKQYKSILLYIFFGGLTTFVSIGSFILFENFMNVHPLVANILSWICAVSFAYVTNRVWVFPSKASGLKILQEIFAFYAGRLLTLGLEEALLLIFVTWLAFNSMLIKVLAQFVVLILNYVISKVLVFRSNSQQSGESRPEQ